MSLRLAGSDALIILRSEYMIQRSDLPPGVVKKCKGMLLTFLVVGQVFYLRLLSTPIIPLALTFSNNYALELWKSLFVQATQALHKRCTYKMASSEQVYLFVKMINCTCHRLIIDL